MPKKLKKKAAFPTVRRPEPYDVDLNEGDLLGQLTEKQGSSLWLGKYTPEEIRHALEKSGILPELRKKGMQHFLITIEPLEEFQQSLKIYHQQKSPEHLLAEARLREVYFKPEPRMQESFSLKSPRMLAIDWLMMQNPYACFTRERPRLPGQQYPGLGVARLVLRLLKALSRMHHLTGILNFPEYFHNAYFYRRYFKFYNPEKEANLYALARDLSPLSVCDMSWAIELGCVYPAEGDRPFEWTSGVQIFPLEKEVKAYFSSSWYENMYHQSFTSQKYWLDRDKFFSEKENYMKEIEA
ncbi:MAG: hypothetical protein D6814_14345 [Calditrichaeota bacterium]|nr:MAG: hypothetical protein D6814_14345 [Calditrichota bacterium]